MQYNTLYALEVWTLAEETTFYDSRLWETNFDK